MAIHGDDNAGGGSGLTGRSAATVANEIGAVFEAVAAQVEALVDAVAAPLEPRGAQRVAVVGAHEPARLARVLQALEGVKAAFETGAKRVSLADLIVLGGVAAVEKAARDAGTPVTVRFRPGRVDAGPEHTDAASFAPLEPAADGFRNFAKPGYAARAEAHLVDRAQLLTLTAPEMTVLAGGLRVLGANHGGLAHGAFTGKSGALTNDFFVNLLDPMVVWTASKSGEGLYDGRDARTGKIVRTGTRADLVFGSNSQLRALAEVYASADAGAKFAADFAAAFAKVMELDRFDLHR